ncbi:reverse transcriptase domain-containing protein [Tanacetum coccineum]
MTLHHLSRILTCFHIASGLKVNFNKSKLYEYGVSNLELNSVVASIGCLASQFPFKSVRSSLGVYYFSNFKAPKKRIKKLESIHRKFFWGGNSDENKISCIAWDKVISPRHKGGLGIGSLLASNQSMLSKWWWRFHAEENALWRKAWLRPTRSQTDQDELTELTTLLSELHLTDALDTWEFIEDPSRNFTVKSMRNHINHMSNPSTSQPIRWNKFLPAKVNILVWRIMNKRVPTRVNLDKRGIDRDFVRCPLCDEDIETEDHLFASYDAAILADRVLILPKLKKAFDVAVNVTLWHLWKFRINIKAKSKGFNSRYTPPTRTAPPTTPKTAPKATTPTTSAAGNTREHVDNAPRCYKCSGLGHYARDCQNPKTPAFVTDDADPIYDTDEVDEPGDELVYPDRGEALVIQRVLNVAVSKSVDDTSWLRNNIFRSKCTSKGKICDMIIDGGSCENVVSTYMVEKLGMKTEDHPEPYQLTWLKKESKYFDFD